MIQGIRDLNFISHLIRWKMRIATPLLAPYFNVFQENLKLVKLIDISEDRLQSWGNWGPS